MIYEKIINQLNIETIIKTDENNNIQSIPLDPANSDYQAYLKYLEETNAN